MPHVDPIPLGPGTDSTACRAQRHPLLHRQRQGLALKADRPRAHGACPSPAAPLPQRCRKLTAGECWNEQCNKHSRATLLLASCEPSHRVHRASPGLLQPIPWLE